MISTNCNFFRYLKASKSLRELGFILLENIISIFLVTLILIPIYNFSSLFIRLKNTKIVNSSLPLNSSVKPLLTDGYTDLSTSIHGSSIGLVGRFSNIGMESGSESTEFIYFIIEYPVYNRTTFYISTKLSQYREFL